MITMSQFLKSDAVVRLMGKVPWVSDYVAGYDGYCVFGRAWIYTTALVRQSALALQNLGYYVCLPREKARDTYLVSNRARVDLAQYRLYFT
jgi:hypothetical protein